MFTMIAGYDGWLPHGGGADTKEPTSSSGKLICIEWAANGKMGPDLQRIAEAGIDATYEVLRVHSLDAPARVG